MVRRKRASRAERILEDMISQNLIVNHIVSRLSARTIYRATGGAVHCQFLNG